MGPDIEALFQSLQQKIREGADASAVFLSLGREERSLLIRWLSQDRKDLSRSRKTSEQAYPGEGEAVAFCDGASRGNPGEAGYGYTILYPHGKKEEGWGYLGKATNNYAEYCGILAALHRLAEEGVRRALIHLDSELVVRQLNGEYRVKSQSLKKLYDEACSLKAMFDALRIRHVPRSENARADSLANKAIDTCETDHFSLDY